MKFLVPQKTDNIFTIWATTSFSSRYLHNGVTSFVSSWVIGWDL